MHDDVASAQPGEERLGSLGRPPPEREHAHITPAVEFRGGPRREEGGTLVAEDLVEEHVAVVGVEVQRSAVALVTGEDLHLDRLIRQGGARGRRPEQAGQRWWNRLFYAQPRC